MALRLPDGRAFVGLASSTVVRDEQGQFVRTNSTLIDITERKRADAALQAQRDFLQNITNSIPVQLAFFDRDLICRFANASYARWLDSSPDELVGQPVLLELLDDRLGDVVEWGVAALAFASQPEAGHGDRLGRGKATRQGISS